MWETALRLVAFVAAPSPDVTSGGSGLEIALIGFAGAVTGAVALIWTSLRHRTANSDDTLFDQSTLQTLAEHGRRLDSHDDRLAELEGWRRDNARSRTRRRSDGQG